MLLFNRDGDRTVLSDNTITGARYGIDAAEHVTVSGNTVYDNTIGITANVGYTTDRTRDNELRIIGNIVSLNDDGIRTNDRRDDDNFPGSVFYTDDGEIIVSNNRVFANDDIGIHASYWNIINGNHIYSNRVGIFTDDAANNDFAGDIINNLLYDNTDFGIIVEQTQYRRGQDVRILNNTIYQIAGDAIRLQNGAEDISIGNNLLWNEAGYGLFVSSGSSDITTDYNLYQRSEDPSSRAVFYLGTAYDTTTDWQAANLGGANSLEGDPLLADIDGADNVLGYITVGNGEDGGTDDNFFLTAGSPAIDSGYSLYHNDLDKDGIPRVDDPGVINTGNPIYLSSTQPHSTGIFGDSYTGEIPGTPMDLHGDNVNELYLFPAGFSFPFYGEEKTSVYVASNGFLQFDSTSDLNDSSNNLDELQERLRIAPLWDDLRTDRTGDDIYVDTSLGDRITFIWDGVTDTGETPVTFAVTLFENGDIRFDYGAGNTNLTPTVGIANGSVIDSIDTAYSGQNPLTHADSLLFTAAYSFMDIGSYEFRGSSLDTTPPTTVGANPPEIDEGGVTNAEVDHIDLIFSEPLNPIDAQARANYELVEAGLNGILGDDDDVTLPLLASYVANERTVSLSIIGGSFDDGLYQLTAFGQPDRGIRDLAGLVIDGDTNGNAGGNYVRVFEFDTTAPIPTVNSLSTNNRRPVLTGTVDDSTAEIFVRVAGRTYTAENLGDGTWSFDGSLLVNPLNNGVHDIEVTARDDAGNIGNDITSNEVFVDATAPIVVFNNVVTNDLSPALTGAVNELSAMVEVIIDGNTYLADVDAVGTWSLAEGVISPALSYQDYLVTVRAIDTLNNVGTTTGTLTVEPLDDLSPTIDAVYVGSSAWTQDFADHINAVGLGQDGWYRVDNLNTSDILPWINIDQLRIVFSEEVNVDLSDISLAGVNLPDYSGQVDNFAYDSQSTSATVSLSEPIAADKLLLEIGAETVADLVGNALATDYQTRFDVLPGDTSRDGVVLGSDVGQVRSRQFEHTTNGTPTTNYSPYYDVDGSGVILGSDVGQTRIRQFTTLPTDEPASLIPQAALSAFEESSSASAVLATYGADESTSDTTLPEVILREEVYQATEVSPLELLLLDNNSSSFQQLSDPSSLTFDNFEEYQDEIDNKESADEAFAQAFEETR